MTTNDPNAAKEWHKKAIGLDLLRGEFKGAGVSVGIYDDGIEKTHAELIKAYDASKEFRLNGVLYNPQGPAGQQNHGTAVAGIIAAQENNGIGGSGIANGARITSVDVLGSVGDSSTSMFAALRYAANFDVMTNSWGWVNAYADGFGTSYGKGFHDALKSAVDTGRGGLGTIITVAAGNSGAVGWDANNSEFTAVRYTIAVGATTDLGYRAYYSNPGANLLVSAPSNGGTAGIYTTDETGAAGYSWGNDTSGFGGTSAATPIVASVAALMLEANHDLGWRDVQEIMAVTADYTSGSFEETGGSKTVNQTDLWAINGAKNVNGGGMAFSNDTGFGQIDAYEAVRFAEVWSLFGNAPKTSANEKVLTSSSSVAKTIAEGGAYTSYQFNVGSGVSVESIALNLVMTHSDVDELRIEVVSPDGTVSQLLRSGIIDANKNAFSNKSWTFSSNEFRGEASAGTWTIRVYDTVAGNTGIISSASLSIYGSDASINNVYHYTDDFLRMLAIEPSRSVITDTNGGLDWLNFSAIGGGVDADLTARTILLRGVSQLTIAAGTAIENVVTGDGNDVLRGNEFANYLAGMRGDDILDGRSGGDVLDGGVGNDTASYSFSSTAVDIDLTREIQSGGDAAGDRLISIENVFGSAFDDRLVGNAGNNEVTGGLGDDFLDGGAGADTAVFDGNRSSYKVYLNNDGTITVSDTRTGGTGTDRLINIEALRFADHTYSVAGFVFDAGSPTPPDNSGGSGTPIQPPPSPAPTIVGTENADTINGTAGNDIITTKAGNDRIAASGGYDLIDGGDGNDTYVLTGAAASYSLYQTTNAQGENVLQVRSATTSADLTNVEFVQFGDSLIAVSDIRTRVLVGSTGNDAFTTQSGDETVLGGAGNDQITGSQGIDVYDGGAGADSVIYSGSNAAVDVNLTGAANHGGFAEGDVLRNIEVVYGSAFGDRFAGNVNADTFYGQDGNDLFAASAGADVYNGGNGVDTIDYAASTAAVQVNLASIGPQFGGLAQGHRLASIENVIGSNYADTLVGTTGANVLSGGSGDDILNGGLGDDNLNGGTGYDVAVLRGSASAYSLTQQADVNGEAVWTLSGPDGTDTLTSIEEIRFDYGRLLLQNGPVYSFTGTAYAEVMTGTAYADELSAGNGNDVLMGSSGADRLDGGLGVDLVDYGASNAAVNVDLRQTTQTGGFAQGDSLISIENMRGSAFGDVLTGDAVANLILAGAGNDAISDGLGNDTIYGEAGDDTLTWGGGIDSFDGGLGIDTVDLSALGQGANVNLAARTVTAGSNRLITGNVEGFVGTAFADVFVGSVANDIIQAGGGDDTMTGSLGNDSLNGGSGFDTAVYSGRRADYTLTTNVDGSLTVQDLRRGGEGTDKLVGVEALRFADGTLLLSAAASASGFQTNDDAIPLFVQAGTAAHELFSGSAVADYIAAGNGNDTVIGTAGADVIDGGLGTDMIDYSASDAAVNVNLQRTGQTGGFAQGDTLISIENMRGSAFGDVLTGDAGANLILAGAGNDTIGDGLGNDTIYGEAGDDTLLWGGGVDGFDGGLGIDTVDLSALGQGANVNLAARVITAGTDRLVMGNVERFVGTAFADTFVGSVAGDIILAGDGDDTMTGSLGNDSLDGGDGFDTAVYSGRRADYILTTNSDGSLTVQDLRRGGEGTDKLVGVEALRFADGVLMMSAVASANGYQTASNGEPLFVQTGTAGNDVLNGSVHADYVLAGAGNDFIWGTTGADHIDGGLGIDTVDYTYSSAAVRVDLGLGAGLGGQAEGDTLFSIETVRGSNFNDELADGTGTETLYGGAGNDTLTWHGGTRDVMDGGIGIDTLDLHLMVSANVNLTTGVATSGLDTATVLGFENVVGTSGSDTIIGNGYANRIDGGAGNDLLTGGAAADTFVFHASDGSDRITDFVRGQDKVEFHGVAWADLSFTLVGSDTVVTYGDSDITLVGVRSVAASDFLFA